MVVEDDPLDFGFLNTAFESLSASAELFHWPEVEGAIAKILETGCNVVILDLSLRGGNGLDLVREIRAHEELATLPIVTLSSSGSMRDVENCYRAGVNAYLEKPLSMEKYRKFVQAFNAFWLNAAVLPR